MGDQKRGSRDENYSTKHLPIINTVATIPIHCAHPTQVLISEGKYAQLLADNRPFTADEESLFDDAAQFAYQSFRNRAAESRGMAVEAMQEVAQGRVWSGMQASQVCWGLPTIQGPDHTKPRILSLEFVCILFNSYDWLQEYCSGIVYIRSITHYSLVRLV